MFLTQHSTANRKGSESDKLDADSLHEMTYCDLLVWGSFPKCLLPLLLRAWDSSGEEEKSRYRYLEHY